MKLNLLLLGIVLVLSACGVKPKVVTSDPNDHNGSGMGMALEESPAMTGTDAHLVICRDFMHTDRYTYMDVEENAKRYWIAVPRQEPVIGATYRYSGGWKRENFRSEKFDRTFDEIVLVSNLEPERGVVDRPASQVHGQDSGAVAINTAPREDVVEIAEIFNNKDTYDGKVVTISGRCVKVNNMIMGRNWVHIEDGSMEGDLTVTTVDNIALGAPATLTGTIGLNRDFGAGYRYDVIMENARLD